MQAAKIIDIKRSFIPVDPNAYPETMHLDTKEDYPESRVPVVPYMGHNFMPTAYGHKSFFGTNSKVDVDSLAPNKPDTIFIFQTLAYKNVIIALCDTGIWAKSAAVAGAWTQLTALAAPGPTAYYEWFVTIISNKLYAYRGNGAAFYKIETDIAQPLGILCTPMVPSFITIANQLGMFKLGSRLGFWDASNAIAWSSPDDFTNFTPAVLTGANVTTFNSVVGKISAIRSHGKDCIVYASKSIVHLAVQPSETFLVKATKIFDAGVPYAQQSVESNPSDINFAYTTAGICKIENGKAEIIVPEIFDFFKTYTAQPIYLKLLQGRFLAFQILDENLINGVPIFSKDSYDEYSLVFPGYQSLDQISDSTGSINLCEVMNKIDDGSYDEIQAAAASQLPDKKPGTSATPIWTCYLSNHGAPEASALTFDNTPCGGAGPNGVPFLMSPNADGLLLGAHTTDGTNKTAKTGNDSWVDGKWTMERFFQVQSAIWDAEEEAQADILSRILAQAFFDQKTTPFVGACVASGPTLSYCDLGEYVSAYSPRRFGYNGCSFWLTRFVLETEVIKARTTVQVECNGTTTAIPLTGWRLIQNGNIQGTIYPTAAAACAAWNYSAGTFHEQLGGAGAIVPTLVGTEYRTNGIYQVVDATNTPVSTPNNNNGCFPIWQQPGHANVTYGTVAGNITGGVLTLPIINEISTTKVETSSAANIVDHTNTGVLGVETAWCEITGWSYTKNDGTTATAAATVCSIVDSSHPGAPAGSGFRTVNDNSPEPEFNNGGMICNVPFLAPLDPPDVNWPDQTLVYPGGSFLLQDGSIAPKNPTIYGAFVYDLHLKKWGKYKDQFKGLLDYSPINNESNSPVTSANFGMLAGVVKDDGYLYIFDDVPEDSLLVWGKIGYYRLGMTDIQEVTFNFRTPATGSIVVDLSLDGRSISNLSHFEEAHSLVSNKTVYPPYSGKWFNIGITGQFDVADLIVNGMSKGRR